jgi:hypothetical protein
MYTTSDTEIIELLLKKANYYALPLKGIDRTFKPEWLIDDLEDPKGLFFTHHYFSFLYSEDEGYLSALAADRLMDGFYGFSGTHPKVFEYMKQHFLIQWLTKSSQYHYTGTVVVEEGAYLVEPVSLDWAEEIDSLYEYKSESTLFEIKRAISERPSACIRIDGTLASWVLLHDDYSIGFMYTKPEFRKLGLAKLVSKSIVNACVEKGITPFLQIVHGNSKSEALAEKSGFLKHADVFWFGIVAPGIESARNIRSDYEKHFKASQPIHFVTSYGLQQLKGLPSRYTVLKEETKLCVFEQGVLQCELALKEADDAFYLLNEIDYIDWTEVLKAISSLEHHPYLAVLFTSTQSLEGVQSLVIDGDRWSLNM